MKSFPQSFKLTDNVKSEIFLDGSSIVSSSHSVVPTLRSDYRRHSDGGIEFFVLNFVGPVHRLAFLGPSDFGTRITREPGHHLPLILEV